MIPPKLRICLCQLIKNITASLLIILKILFQNMWEKEYFYDSKKNKKLDENDCPQSFAKLH